MARVELASNSRARLPVDAAACTALKSALRGALLEPGDGGYEQARRIHNAMIDKRPALIARCAGATDVIECVRFAQQHGIAVSVKGTGHNVAGLALCDGGLVIDLSGMKGIRISPSARTARVEAGVTWGELNHDLQVFGLAATGGFISTTSRFAWIPVRA